MHCRLHLEKLEDWLFVTGRELMELGEWDNIVQNFGASFTLTLEELFPEIEWYHWHAAHMPKYFWEDVSNQERYFQWLAQRLSIEKPEDWYIFVSRYYASDEKLLGME